jgi:hypothetical protein
MGGASGAPFVRFEAGEATGAVEVGAGTAGGLATATFGLVASSAAR